jgi:hypothetical protein
MPSALSLVERLRRVAPEAFAFGVIGAANSALYFAITYVALPIGAVKATVIATIVGFNGVGMIIQSGSVAVAKYGFHLNESDHKMLIMGITLAAAVVATVFRFWAYRTFVFLKPPVDGHEAAIAELDVAAGLAELSAQDVSAEPDLDAELASELDSQRAERR